MASMNLLTDEAIATLREMARWWRNNRNAPPVAAYDEYQQIPQAPETYIALVPSGGIPALTGSGTSGGDMPGSAACDIYQINEFGELTNAGFTKPVFNLSDTDIGAGWIPITREKFGRWLAPWQAATADTHGSFDGIAEQHIAMGGFGDVTDGSTTYTVYCPYGAVNHGDEVWVEWDTVLLRWTGIQTNCVTGSAT